MLPAISQVLLAFLTVTYSTIAYGGDLPTRLPMVSVISTAVPGKDDSFTGAAVAATIFTSKDKTASSLRVLYTNDTSMPVDKWGEAAIPGALAGGGKCIHQLTPVLYNNALRGGNKGDLHLFFICSQKAGEGGALTHSTSSDYGSTWSAPVRLVHKGNAGLLLASSSVVDSGSMMGSQWSLIAVGGLQDIKIIQLEANGTVLRILSSVKSIKGGKLANSMFPYAGVDTDNVGAVLVMENTAMKFSSVVTDDLNINDPDVTSWRLFSNEKDTYMPSENNKDASFIPRIASASSVLPISLACATTKKTHTKHKRSMMTYISAAESDDGAVVSYGSSSTAEGLLKRTKGGYHTLGSYPLKDVTRAPVHGLAAGLLPSPVPVRDPNEPPQCAYELGMKDVVIGTRAIIVVIVGDGTRSLKTSMKLRVTPIFSGSVPDQNRDGEPALAASITFIILGGVSIGLIIVFIIGFLKARASRNRSRRESILEEGDNSTKRMPSLTQAVSTDRLCIRSDV